MELLFWPPKSGTYEFSLTQVGTAVLTIDGVRIIDDETPTRPPAGAELFPIPMRVVQLELRAGRGYPIQLEYVSGTLAFHLFRFGIRPPAGTIDEAVRIARDADVAVVFVGVSTTSETEGADRRDMELFGPQNELVEAVAAANPHTVVVLNNGAPLRLPWIDRVSAVVEAWLPGQEGARAVAEVLLGMANPCGKLPLTFPRGSRTIRATCITRTAATRTTVRACSSAIATTRRRSSSRCFRSATASRTRRSSTRTCARRTTSWPASRSTSASKSPILARCRGRKPCSCTSATR